MGQDGGTDGSDGGSGTNGGEGAVRMIDGTRLVGEQLQDLITQARAEAWEVLSTGDRLTLSSPPEGVNEFEDAIDVTLDEAHLAAAHDLPDLFSRHAAVLGASSAVVYLADLQQSVLVPFLGPGVPADAAPTVLAMDATLAGVAFQRLKVLTQSTGGSASGVQPPGSQSAGLRVWLPLLDGTDRLGVLGVELPAASPGYPDEDVDEQARSGALGRRLRRLAALAAELVMTKTLYGDTIVRLRRQAPLGLAAELQWSQLPPLTFACHDLVIAAALEPAYDVAGDAVDYAVDDGWARFAIFDGMGHGLQSAHLSVLAVAAYRNARRAGCTLAETARAVDDAVHDFAPGETFCSGLLVELNTDTGQLAWVNAGHPEPLVLRAGRLAATLTVDPSQPFGMRLEAKGEREDQGYPIGTGKLQPGDRLVLYTDGVTDAHCPDGNRFGLDRLVDLLTRTDDPRLPPPETMRRVVRALLEHQQDRLPDDATLLAVDWRRPDQDDVLVP